MKKSLTTLLPIQLTAVCLGLALAGVAAAALPGGIGTTPTPREPAGEWHARVRYLNPHSGPDGRYLTWSYADIVAPTQESCDYQLQSWYSGGNTVIVDYCYLVPFGG